MKRIPLIIMMLCFAVLQLNAQNNNATATKRHLIFYYYYRWLKMAGTFNGMQDDIVNQKSFIVGIVIIYLTDMVVQLRNCVVKN